MSANSRAESRSRRAPDVDVDLTTFVHPTSGRVRYRLLRDYEALQVFE